MDELAGSSQHDILRFFEITNNTRLQLSSPGNFFHNLKFVEIVRKANSQNTGTFLKVCVPFSGI